MKKALSLLLCTLIICALLPLNAFASYQYVEDYSETDLYKAICAALDAYSRGGPFKGFDITKSEFEAISYQAYRNEPQYFYWGEDSQYYSFGYDPETWCPNYSIYFDNPYTAEECEQKSIEFNNMLDSIIAGMPENLNDLQKALYLKDYISVNYEYDYSYTIYNAYDMINDKKGVCMAYTRLYDALLEKVGIDSRAVQSDTLNHIWNQIYIDGNWYHVDTTWCDPSVDRYGNSKSNYFLFSDEAFDRIHNNGATDVKIIYHCDDTTYDNLSWHNTTNSFAFSNGKTYMSDGDTIFEVNLKTGETVAVYENDSVWVEPSGAESYYKYMQLGSYNNLIVFNTDKEIKTFDPITSEVKTLYNIQSENQNIYGMTVHGKKVTYFASGYASDEINLSVYEIPEVETVLGDISCDGELKASDYLLLKSVVLGNYQLTKAQKSRADYNQDGEISAIDYWTLKRAVLFN